MKNLKLILLVGLLIVGCSKKDDSTNTTTSAEDPSSSGLAASAVGGAINSSDSGGASAMMSPVKPSSVTPLMGLFILKAEAATICPRLTTANGSGCTNGGTYVDLSYAGCTLGNGVATWTGTMEVSISGGAGIACGTFPAPNNQFLQRQMVASAGVPGTGTRTSARGTVVYIDHATANLGNFDNQTIAANIGSGYGARIGFTGTARSSVQVRQRLYVTNGFDHSIDGSITISESGTTRTTSGSVKVYHNKLKVVGTSTFTSVVYNNTSCVPVSGTISTAYAAGTNIAPTAAGTLLVGKTESITFNADGTATSVDSAGVSTTVAMTHCF